MIPYFWHPELTIPNSMDNEKSERVGFILDESIRYIMMAFLFSPD